MRILWIAPLCLTLAACGGSGTPVVENPTVPNAPAAPTAPTNPDPATPTDPAAPTAPATPPAAPTTSPTSPPTGDAESGAQMRAGANSLLSTYADPVTFTPINSVPDTVTATYDGYAYGTLGNNADNITNTLTGALSMTLTLNGNNATVTGTLSDFVDDADNAVSGSLALSGGRFDRNGDPTVDATFGALFSGTLMAGENALTVGGNLEGDLLGADRNAVGGKLLGSVTYEGDTQDIDGGFIADR